MCRHAKRLPVALLALLAPSPVVAFSVLSFATVDDASSVAFRGALSVSGASVLQADLAAPLPAPDAPPSSATSASTPLLNGSAAGGTLLHIQGNGFPTSTAAVSVELVDTADGATALTTCEVLASSASGLLCRTAAAADPDSAAGRVAMLRLSVVDAGGGETAGTAEAPEVFSLLADSDVATISTVTPAAGSAAGGLVICIGGSRLLAGGTPTAMLGSTPCATVNATSAELCCRTPDHPTTGGVNLRVHDSLRGFARATTTLTFAYLTPPELASISPPAGHAGTVVTMSGSGLVSAQLTLGGAPCTLTSYSDTEATCTAGDAAAGPATVELVVAGIGAARVAASVNFTYANSRLPRFVRRLSGMPANTGVLINITCTLIGFSLEANNGTLDTLCTDNGTQYPLAGDQATRQWIDQFEWGMKLATTLTPQNEEGGVVYSIIDANLVPGPPPMNSVATIQGSGRYFSGERRIRLLSVLVEVQGLSAEYAGSTRAEREAWAIDQRRFMDESWRFGTFGKLGFDEEASRVVTVDLGTFDTGQQNCFWRGFAFASAASAQVAPAMTP